ncbi:hypothetical protein ACQPZX_39235 [Actinoplanes sp. CA-142083]|uniref:hypothetical protein n=1 Tax=Actinoplanes sp. CA-142083 TaxID=3239903 RepID=UPI003D8D4AC7
MTEHAPDRIWSGIDIPKTIAGVLAALSAAVIGSFLGVAGTLAGAAVASLIGSVGTEVYQRSIHKGTRKLQGTFTAAPAAVGTPPVAAAADTTVALPAMTAAPSRKIRWKRVALVAGSLFILAMGTLTVAELISGRSIEAATKGGAAGRSTVSTIFGDSSKSDKSEKSTPTPSESADPGETADPGATPTEQATPTDTATQQPTDTPTTDPATQAPAGNTETGGTDSGSGSDSGSDSGSGGGADAAPQTGSDATGNTGTEGP